jgi:hypothetical protein
MITHIITSKTKCRFMAKVIMDEIIPGVWKAGKKV